MASQLGRPLAPVLPVYMPAMVTDTSLKRHSRVIVWFISDTSNLIMGHQMRLQWRFVIELHCS